MSFISELIERLKRTVPAEQVLAMTMTVISDTMSGKMPGDTKIIGGITADTLRNFGPFWRVQPVLSALTGIIVGLIQRESVLEMCTLILESQEEFNEVFTALGEYHLGQMPSIIEAADKMFPDITVNGDEDDLVGDVVKHTIELVSRHVNDEEAGKRMASSLMEDAKWIATAPAPTTLQ